MAVEILTVSLSDESIEAVAQRVAQIMGGHVQLVSGEPTTVSNPPSSQVPHSAEQPGFQNQAPPSQNGGWTNNPPPQAPAQQQYQQGPPQQQAPQQEQGPMCNCGQPKRWVPPGFSKNTGKSFQGFWACPQPRGQQCPR